jgi:hypothetical protein
VSIAPTSFRRSSGASGSMMRAISSFVRALNVAKVFAPFFVSRMCARRASVPDAVRAMSPSFSSRRRIRLR